MSNHRNGFKVTMGATALKHAENAEYIGYTVTAGGVSITVAKADGATEKTNATAVISSGPITTANVQCKQISITINETELNEALPGTYEGTVKFYYEATT